MSLDLTEPEAGNGLVGCLATVNATADVACLFFVGALGTGGNRDFVGTDSKNANLSKRLVAASARPLPISLFVWGLSAAGIDTLEAPFDV